ncbi:MAG TPA: GAF domain-containing sensor histidine kinase [Roseiflexaceae bacterium]|jgi:signal transduction histidine kinase|nr:GAF domain-containing sensor histidine kinase [Roseiflexaceae bacterium]
MQDTHAAARGVPGHADPQHTNVTSNDRWLQLGGDRFYTLARWLIIILLFGTSGLLTNGPLWPPLATMNPFALVVWAYTLFSILITASLFFRPPSAIRSLTFFIDIAFITLLTLVSRDNADLFYPLYLLPLIGAAIQMSPQAGLAVGIIAALAYMAAFLVPLIGPNNGRLPRDALALVALALRASTLIFIPWLAGGLAERSGTVNRSSVARAELETERALNEARSYGERMRSLYEVAYSLSTTMNYQSVLNIALVESRRLVQYTCAMVLLSTGDVDELYVAAAQGVRDDEKGARLLIGKGKVEQSLRSGDAMLLTDVNKEPELQEIKSLQNCRAGCLVPLRAGLRTYGVMLIASDYVDSFTDEDLGMITALANYAIIALHNAQLIHDVREERNKLLSKEEEVRHQLARDLHDGPAQALAAIAMNIEFIKRLLQRDPERVVPELDKLATLAKRTTHEVRTMLFELRPLVLETQGLDVTLQQYFERFRDNKTKIVLETDQITTEIDTRTEGTLFNIIQESVNNALKHAQAEHIWVRLKQTATTLEATIQDDGRGFDLRKVQASYDQRGSFGLLNIEERAQLIGGMAELFSAPGQGTTVRVLVPLQ